MTNYHRLTMPSGAVATRNSKTRTYVAAVVVTRTEAQAEAAELVVAQILDAATDESRAEYAALVARFNAARTPVIKAHTEGQKAPGNLWAAWNKAEQAMSRHALYSVSPEGGHNVDAAKSTRANVGMSTVECWNMTMARAQEMAARLSVKTLAHVSIVVPEVATSPFVKG